VDVRTQHLSATDLVDWRAQQLLRHGFDRALAIRMAADAGFDLHTAIELVERGCPPHLAARIIAPLAPREGERDRG
jgi:hypothetical protein